MKKEVQIKSLVDYINRVTKLKTRNNNDSLLYYETVFRGLSSKRYPLVPSLGRHPSVRWINSYTFVERDLISEAQQKFPDSFPSGSLPLVTLARLQHFGIPTRMMDVTSSALVALYFACQESKNYPEDDGEVVVLCGHPAVAVNATANIVADTYRLTNNNALTPLETYYYRAIKQDYSVSLQYPNWETKHNEAIKSFRQSLERPFIVNAFEVSMRQKNQQGKFVIYPNEIFKLENDKEFYVADNLVKLERDDPMIIQRYIVPNTIKSEIVKKLEILGISKEYLFVDNVDAVFEAVKEHQESRYN